MSLNSGCKDEVSAGKEHSLEWRIRWPKVLFCALVCIIWNWISVSGKGEGPSIPIEDDVGLWSARAAWGGKEGVITAQLRTLGRDIAWW